MEFSRKPYAVNVFPLGEEVEKKNFDVQVSNKNIVLVAMKKADKKDGLILRFINNCSTKQETNKKIGNQTCKVQFGKYEVKTFFYDEA